MPIVFLVNTRAFFFKEPGSFFLFALKTHLPKWTQSGISYLDPKKNTGAFGARGNVWYGIPRKWIKRHVFHDCDHFSTHMFDFELVFVAKASVY